MTKFYVLLLIVFMTCSIVIAGENEPNDKANSSGLEKRCGMLSNPTPANWWLIDKDGTWIIGAQGGYQVSDESYDHLPQFPQNGKYWKNTNGSHGYGCVCLMVKVDRKKERVLEIQNGQTLPLAKCLADKNLNFKSR